MKIAGVYELLGQPSYMRIENLPRPRQILRAVKVRAISLGKEPCSFAKLFIHFNDSFKESLSSLKVKVVSSAYWLTRYLDCLILIPFILGLFFKDALNSSTQRIKR